MMDKIKPFLLEKITKHRLLDSNLENKRNSCRIAVLPTEGYPKDYFINANNQDGKSPEFNEDHYPHEELISKCGNNDSYLLYRKAFPHCLYGMMLLRNGNTTQVCLNDFSLEERRGFLETAKKFAIFSEANNIYPNISWTYDPLTRDRSSGQSQLWYHMHLNSHTEDTKKEIQRIAKPMGEIEGEETKRSFIEEFSVVASFILDDYLSSKGEKISGTVKPPFSIEGLPNLGILYNKDWNYVDTDMFLGDLEVIHSAILDLYKMFKDILYTGQTNIWERPQRNNKQLLRKDFPWMKDSTFNVLNLFISNLDSELLNKYIDFFRLHPKSQLTSFLYPLAGASYSTTITRHSDGGLLLSIRPQMFSAVGAAGLHYVFNTTVKLQRGSKVYTEDELVKKENFENDFKYFLKI